MKRSSEVLEEAVPIMLTASESPPQRAPFSSGPIEQQDDNDGMARGDQSQRL